MDLSPLAMFGQKSLLVNVEGALFTDSYMSLCNQKLQGDIPV